MKWRRKNKEGQGHEPVVFQRSAKEQPNRDWSRIKCLERSCRKGPVINNRSLHQQAKLGRRINPPTPDTPADGIEVLGMLSDQERFRFSVALLLFEVIGDRRAPVMPDKSGGTESEAVFRLLQAPANVHIISGLAENRIEASDFLQSPFIKGHVAPRDMLR